jgi:carbon catabolite-derepressing protein kinase
VDLQLYKLDINSYLVDFKSLGQVMAEGYSLQVSPNASNVSSDDIQLSDRFSDDFSYENTIRQVTLLSEQADAANESVLSTFPFLDVCSKLITELAISS